MSLDPFYDKTEDGLRKRIWLHPPYASATGGITAGRLYYCVGTADRAYSFTVYTGVYPPEAKQEPIKPQGWDVSVHIKVPDAMSAPCRCIDDAPCEGDGSAFLAYELYAKWLEQGNGEVKHETILDYLTAAHRSAMWFR